MMNQESRAKTELLGIGAALWRSGKCFDVAGFEYDGKEYYAVINEPRKVYVSIYEAGKSFSADRHLEFTVDETGEARVRKTVGDFPLSMGDVLSDENFEAGLKKKYGSLGRFMRKARRKK